jgi:segregation and condensation protein B
MSLKAKLEAIIYATEEPVTLNELAALLKDAVLADLRAEEEARLALNETISGGPPADDDQELLPVDDDIQHPPAEPPAPAVELVDASGPEVQPEAATQTEKPDNPKSEEKEQLKAVKARLSYVLNELIADYASPARGMEIRQIAGGYRMTTKPEHHDVVVSFAKSLKPPVRLSLQALETLAVIAYKQPITVPEISEIRGVDSSGVIATLLDRKLITTAGRKQVIGRPILYKTTKEFLLRFGLKDVNELPSAEEFEKLGDPQAGLFNAASEQSPPSPSPVEEEPVTEAVPDPSHHLVGDPTVSADGTYATEAEPENAPSDPGANVPQT